MDDPKWYQKLQQVSDDGGIYVVNLLSEVSILLRLVAIKLRKWRYNFINLSCDQSEIMWL